ncbi:MAG: DUF1080 domain-containing protein [Opitutaceae bacterium]|nr:DUF1080 domain-containing protein [Opitutaceae bacterium]
MKILPPHLFLASALLAGLAAAERPAVTVSLFNGHNLEGWTTYAQNAAPAAADTWTVGDGVIRCSGQPHGYLRTTGRYRDYRLTVEWRWVPGPAPVDAQGKPRSRNSGVLLHMQAPDTIWPRSLEAQLMETNAGDFYAIGGVETAQLATAREQALAAATDDASRTRARNTRRVPRQSATSEKPLGEWNRYEITCRGDQVTVVVNGVTQNTATSVSVSEGHICLQSEGAPIEFRNVKLAPLPE